MENNETITRTFAQEAESLAYVVMYSLYKHALEDPQVTGTAKSKLAEEFRKLFGATTVNELLRKRQETFLTGDVDERFPCLQEYLLRDRPLRLCAIVTARFLSHLNAPPPAQPRLDQDFIFADRVLRGLDQPVPLPFEAAYRGWVRALRSAAFHAAGGKGDEEEWMRVHFGEDL